MQKEYLMALLLSQYKMINWLIEQVVDCQSRSYWIKEPLSLLISILYGENMDKYPDIIHAL
jgi:hypothetical protein